MSRFQEGIPIVSDRNDELAEFCLSANIPLIIIFLDLVCTVGVHDVANSEDDHVTGFTRQLCLTAA